VPEVGQTIAGKYRIVRPIGAGGMGTVVAATHVQLGTQLALKFLSERIKDSASSVERFTREARACAQLKSEHVCRVTDFGVDDGRPYIAMELLDGVDLARLIDSGRVESGLAVDFVMQACLGLAEAHALGIVHRDLKPGNLFLTRRPDGAPLIKVLDFGVAKIPTEDDHSLTKTSHVVGSPGYMAPEQLRSSKTVDRRADVWALGVILYELISARHPFHAEATTEIALKIAMDEPPPLEEAPEGLRAVVMQCLAKEPDARFADVGALSAALAPFVHHDRAAAAAAMGQVIDAAVLRRTAVDPTTVASRDATAATKLETPRKRPDTSHEAGAGALIAKPAPTRKRTVWILGSVITAGIAGAALVAALGTGEDPPPIAIASPPDAAVVPDAAIALEEVNLEIKVAGISEATIVVDGIVWGEGKRIKAKTTKGRHEITARVPGRADFTEIRDLTGDTSVTIAIPAVTRVPVNTVTKLAETFRLKGATAAKTVPAGTGSSTTPGASAGVTADAGSTTTPGASTSTPAGSGARPGTGAGVTAGSGAKPGASVGVTGGSGSPPSDTKPGTSTGVTVGSGSPAGSATNPGTGVTAGSGSAATPASAGSAAKPGAGVTAGSGATAATSDAGAAATALRQMRARLQARGLTSDDLGNVGVNLFNEVSRGQRAKNWPVVINAATKIEALARDLKIDRAFITTKSARVTARLGQSQASDVLRGEVIQLQTSAKTSADQGDFTAANETLNRALALVPRGRPRDPSSSTLQDSLK
jgi:hypothetical protein